MITRRDALMSVLFGGGMLGLRSIATGIPAKVLLDPRKALADQTTNACMGAPGAAQFVILNTSGQGDPMSCNAPGCYDDPNLASMVHPADPSMAPTPVMIGGQSYTAAKPWSTLPANVLSRACFCHIMTDTPVHPKEPQVLQLMGATAAAEMFPSILAAQLAPCLQTLQTQPISVGAATPSEALTFQGQALPTIPPSALSATLSNPPGELTTLQALRDSTLNSLYGVYKNGATKAQQQYVDSVVTSQQQVRGINQSLLTTLQTINDNTIASQITAAVTLIQMKIAPVIAIHIPFGGDNHSDPGLATETSQTVGAPPTPGGIPTGGVAAIVYLMNALQAAGLQDAVSFVSLNVFGRTMGPGNTAGRQHNQYHQMSLMIGKPFNGAVVGGIGPVDANGNPVAPGASNLFDFGALPINSTTGKGGAGGDIQPVDTLASFGKTVLTAVGVPSSVVGQQITGGTVIQGALAG
jgi:hypothetical protein